MQRPVPRWAKAPENIKHDSKKGFDRVASVRKSVINFEARPQTVRTHSSSVHPQHVTPDLSVW